MNPSSLAAMEAAAGVPMNFNEAIINMGHSALLGAGLMLITVLATHHTVTAPAASTAVVPGEEPDSPAELVLSSANVMFICFGMTAVMQLVNNNLARAFTIGAAIALIRFKIKMNSKAVNMGLFYGAVVGMACGVDQVVLGYAAVGFFAVLQFMVITTAKVVDRATRSATAQTQPPQQTPIPDSSTSTSGTVIAAAALATQPLPAAPQTAQSPLQD